MKVFGTTLLVISVGSLIPSVAADLGTAFFESEIAPILEQRCYEYHSHESDEVKGGLVLDSRSGWETGGESGSAIIPGEPDKSLLIQAVKYQDEELQMPPEEKKLPEGEIALLEKWVAMGTSDPRRAKQREYDAVKLWALEPIRKYDPPAISKLEWPRDDIDRIILGINGHAGSLPHR